MLLSLVGLNHNTASIEMREKLASGTVDLAEALMLLHERVGGGIILSTCNRTEIYVVGDDAGITQKKATDFVHVLSRTPAKVLRPHLYSYVHEEAVRHLFRVASGLDSMIVGEHEILGQVGRALEMAEDMKVTPAPLLNLFRQAISVGRRVRDETHISRNALSVSSVAVAMANRTFGDLSACQVLVVGAGEAGRLATQVLVGNGVSQIVVASRSYESAVRLASEIGSGAVPMRSIEEALSTSDIVVTCTNSPHYILERAVVNKAMASRPKRSLVVIDIAVPRDVSPDVKEIRNVFLYDIDGLSDVSESNLREREEEVEEVQRIVDVEVERFVRWWNSIGMTPMIGALVNKAEDIRRERFEKTLSKMNEISEEDRASIEEMTKSIVRRLLHDPILCLKRSNGSQLGPMVREIFNLSDEIGPNEELVEQD